MGTLVIPRFSGAYAVRALTEGDVETVLALYAGNTLFFRDLGRAPEASDVRRDMTLLPPDVPQERKYYVGYFEAGALMAVLDLIDGYPQPDIAFLGLFMVCAAQSGQGRGTAILTELKRYLASRGFAALRLAYDPDNPQAARFWRKNGFQPRYESCNAEHARLIVAEYELERRRRYAADWKWPGHHP